MALSDCLAAPDSLGIERAEAWLQVSGWCQATNSWNNETYARNAIYGIGEIRVPNHLTERPFSTPASVFSPIETFVLGNDQDHQV